MACAFTQEQLDALLAAYTSGVLEVTDTDGRKVRYRSMDDLRRAISAMKQCLSGTKKKAFTYAVPSRGRGCNAGIKGC